MMSDIETLMDGFLSLYNKQIGDEGIKTICSKDCNKVTILGLSRNKISCKGMRWFSLAKWTNLTNIDLQDNLLNDISCKFLTRTHIPKLQQLGLCANLFGRVGVAHLSKGNWRYMDRIYLQDFDSSIVSSASHEKRQLKLQSLKEILKAGWPRIQVIKLTDTRMRVQQMRYLVLIQSKTLTTVVASSSLIDKKERSELENLFAQRFGAGKIKLPSSCYSLEFLDGIGQMLAARQRRRN